MQHERMLLEPLLICYQFDFSDLGRVQKSCPSYAALHVVTEAGQQLTLYGHSGAGI